MEVRHTYVFDTGPSSNLHADTVIKFEVKKDNNNTGDQVYIATVDNGKLIKNGTYGTEGSTLTFQIPYEFINGDGNEETVIRIYGTSKNGSGATLDYSFSGYPELQQINLHNSSLNDSCMIVDIDEKGDRIIVGAPAYNNNNGLCD